MAEDRVLTEWESEQPRGALREMKVGVGHDARYGPGQPLLPEREFVAAYWTEESGDA